VNVLYGTQIDDNHPNAPLLPPDEIEQNGILHKLYDIKDARKWYNAQKHVVIRNLNLVPVEESI